MSIPIPANGGVLVLLSINPRSVWEDDHSPQSGVVVALGGGVPWLARGEYVTFEPAGAAFYDQGVAVVSQRSILAHQPDTRVQTVCRNGCFGANGCSECPEDRWDYSLPAPFAPQPLAG